MSALRDLFPYLQGLGAETATLTLDKDASACAREELQEVVPVLVEHLLACERISLGLLMPGLAALHELPVGATFTQRRSRNALARRSIRTWRELAELTPHDLLHLQSVGARTVRDILRRCVERVLFGTPEERSGDVPAERWDSEVVSRSLGTIRLLAAWAGTRRRSGRLSEVLRLNPEVGPLPMDLDRAWRELSELNPLLLADPMVVGSEPLELARELLESLDDAERVVYEQRMLADPPATLDEVGQLLGLTRERARQIQINALYCIESVMESNRYRPLLWRASELRSAMGRTAPIGHASVAAALARVVDAAAGSGEDHQDLERFLLHLAGPYRRRNGWFELSTEASLEDTAIAAIADRNGLIPMSAACAWLSQQGVVSEFHGDWLRRNSRIRCEGEVLVYWSGSVVDKSVALLALWGQPADAETLVTAIAEGHSVRSAQNGLLGDERLVRVNRSQWALREWGVEEYTGLTDEISQRIVAAGGRARLADVVTELVQQFGVRDLSVKVYAEAPMFVVEDGYVRLRREDEPFEVKSGFASCRGTYRTGPTAVSILIAVDRELLRGSGRTFPAPVAVALGVLPGRPKKFTWSRGDVWLTWPVTAAFGPSLGSTRSLALEVAAVEGDQLRIDLDSESNAVRAERIAPLSADTSPAVALRLLTGLSLDGQDPSEAIAAAIGVTPVEVRRRLTDRGDSAVANCLPSPSLDQSLETALSELADTLRERS